MSAEAEGAVDDHGPRAPGDAGPIRTLQGGRQQVQAPLEHHRDVSLAQCALSGPALAVAGPYVCRTRAENAEMCWMCP
ncbi:hypothetical protein SSP531S_25670 [Streptomyces spongiicola]|uniref:Uncharacterized protein n=1 Tax=Streptomyces spongiicola TaxID=1690221 RepID=A0A388T1P2_9ACTN|nr:hypothetical protein SSP531S_25670 [Streptomyces spongiicola]